MNRYSSFLTANALRASLSMSTWPLHPTSSCGAITQRYGIISLHWRICRQRTQILLGCKEAEFQYTILSQRSAVALLCCTFCPACCLQNFLLSSPVWGLTFYLQAFCTVLEMMHIELLVRVNRSCVLAELMFTYYSVRFSQKSGHFFAVFVGKKRVQLF